MMPSLQQRLTWMWLLALLASGGCKQSNFVPVSGQVTLDGKPLAGVMVTFQPQSTQSGINGGGSSAKTDEGGHYTLRSMIEDREGAVVGSHQVEIAAIVDASSDLDTGGRLPKAKIYIPARYNSKTELTMEVPPGGKKDANFALTSK